MVSAVEIEPIVADPVPEPLGDYELGRAAGLREALDLAAGYGCVGADLVAGIRHRIMEARGR